MTKDVWGPLLATLVAGLLAIAWPWIQSFQRGRRFTVLLKRELQELGPFPETSDGDPWWEHLIRRFVHEDLLAPENRTANRDFILGLNPTTVYFVTQLWSAYGKRNPRQWLHYLEALSTDKAVGSDELKDAHQLWKKLIGPLEDESANELVRSSATRTPSAVERVPGLFEARLSAYRELAELLQSDDLDDARLKPWYASSGLLLSGDALQAFLALREVLRDASSVNAVSSSQSSLRTELKIDLGVRELAERDIDIRSMRGTF